MVYKWELQIPKLMPELKRRAYLYLPACYDEQPDARFPVMYMQRALSGIIPSSCR